MLLSAEHLSINFGSRQLLDDVNFYLNEGDKVGVIGINGTRQWRNPPRCWSRSSSTSPPSSGS